jgi:glycerol uptake facilitator-like aquaporin
MKKLLAEFLGTFALALAVGLSLTGKFPVPTPVAAALTLGICVYTFGAISGTHINPAITIGLAALRKIGLAEAGLYIVAQFAGAGLARFVAACLSGSAPHAGASDSLSIVLAEALGAFWLAIGVASVVHEKVPAPAAGLTIGGSLLLGIMMAAPISNGVLNPAVALGIGSFSVSYALGPVVGAVAAMFLYRFLAAD